MLTDDAANLRLAKEMGISVATCEDYVRAMTGFPNLVDKLSKPSSSESFDGDSKKKMIFPQHLGPNEINIGIKSKKLFQGIFYLSRTNYLEGKNIFGS